MWCQKQLPYPVYVRADIFCASLPTRVRVDISTMQRHLLSQTGRQIFTDSHLQNGRSIAAGQPPYPDRALFIYSIPEVIILCLPWQRLLRQRPLSLIPRFALNTDSDLVAIAIALQLYAPRSRGWVTPIITIQSGCIALTRQDLRSPIENLQTARKILCACQVRR